jgi:hypothetical protein
MLERLAPALVPPQPSGDFVTWICLGIRLAKTVSSMWGSLVPAMGLAPLCLRYRPPVTALLSQVATTARLLDQEAKVVERAASLPVGPARPSEPKATRVARL